MLVKSLTKFERTLNKKRTYRFLRARFHVNARNLRARRESVHMQFLICDRRFTKIDGWETVDLQQSIFQFFIVTYAHHATHLPITETFVLLKYLKLHFNGFVKYLNWYYKLSFGIKKVIKNNSKQRFHPTTDSKTRFFLQPNFLFFYTSAKWQIGNPICKMIISDSANHQRDKYRLIGARDFIIDF